MDYVDVVNEVHKRFRLEVTSAQVEQVFHDLVTAKTKVRPGSRVSVEMTSKFPVESSQTEATQPKSAVPSQTQPPQPSTDNLGHALHFVKSVHGLTNAKRALAELESILLE